MAARALSLFLTLVLTALPSAQDQPRQAQQGPSAEEPVLGSRAGFDLSAEGADSIALEAGVRLRAQPDLRATEVLTLPEALELPVVERRGSWVRVQYGHQRGWTLLRGGSTSEPLPRLESLPTAQDLDDLRAAFGDSTRESALGPYRLITDVEDVALIENLDRVAQHLAAAYMARFGLDPGEPKGEVVALFARQADYRVYADGNPDQVGLDAPGLAGNGLAALAVEGPSRDFLPGLLIHELTHLMNRRALGPGDRLPPWLDEGMAEDLAYSELQASGKVRLGSLGGRAGSSRVLSSGPNHLGSRVEITATGPRAALERLAESFGGEACPSLAALTDLPWTAFREATRRPLLYSESAFFIRYLLDGEGGRRAPAFRAFLRLVARDEPAGPEVLAAALGTTFPELEDGFAGWLRLQTGRVKPVRPGG